MLSSHQGSVIEAAIGRASADHDMVQALPTELVRGCFRLLGFRERIFVSHVSRAWRSAALNDCFLWNEAPSPHTGCRRGSQMLRLLLARSNPLPFSFSWESPFLRVYLPRDTADVVCGSMHRMKTLYIKDLASNDRERLFRLPAPLLKTFGSEDAKGSPVRPALWPILEDLRIVSLVFPSGPQPFAGIRTFHCWDIDHFVYDDISVFSVFPALRTLRIRNIMEEDLPCLSDPPESMDEISLGMVDAFEIDYTLLLRSFRGLRVKRLCLHMAHEAAGLVELFTASIKGPWRLEIDEQTAGTRAELREDGQDRHWTVSGDERISFYREPRLVACFLRLDSLTGSITLLVELHNLAHGWSRSLPALRTLTLQILQSGNTEDLPSPHRTAPISMPLLVSLTMWLDGMTGEIKQLLETRLPALIPVILERAPQVIIEVVDLIIVRGCDLTLLTAVAQELLVQERRSDKTPAHDPHEDLT